MNFIIYTGECVTNAKWLLVWTTVSLYCYLNTLNLSWFFWISNKHPSFQVKMYLSGKKRDYLSMCCTPEDAITFTKNLCSDHHCTKTMNILADYKFTTFSSITHYFVRSFSQTSPVTFYCFLAMPTLTQLVRGWTEV